MTEQDQDKVKLIANAVSVLIDSINAAREKEIQYLYALEAAEEVNYTTTGDTYRNTQALKEAEAFLSVAIIHLGCITIT